MSLQTINNNESGYIVRSKINNNFAELLAQINALNIGGFKGLIDGVTSTITGMVEGDWYFALYDSENGYSITATLPPNALGVSAGELCIIRYNGSLWEKLTITDDIGGSGTGSMTAGEIRDALRTLLGSNRLPKAAIWGADFALNYRGTQDFNNYASLGGFTMKQGDFVICSTTNTGIYNDGDWAIAMSDGLTPMEIEDLPDRFLFLSLGLLSSIGLTAEQVRDKLKTLSGDEKLAKQDIYGSEKGLNLKGVGDLYDSAFRLVTMSEDISAGDMWVHHSDDSANPGDSLDSSDTSNLKNGDILLAIIDSPDIDNYTDDLDWVIIRQNPNQYQDVAFSTTTNTNDTIDLYAKDSDVVRLTFNTTPISNVKYFGKGVKGSRKKLWLYNSYVGLPLIFTFVNTALGSNGIHFTGAGATCSYNIVTERSCFIDAICIETDQWLVTNVATASTSGPKAPEEPTINYGLFSYFNSDEITCTNASTYYPLAVSFTSDPIENFSETSDLDFKYDGELTQYFQINWSATLGSDEDNTTVSLGFEKNTSFVASSKMAAFFEGNGIIHCLSGVCVLQLEQDDVITPVVASDVAGASISFVDFRMTIKPFFN